MQRFYSEALACGLIRAVPEIRFALGSDSRCHEVAQG